MPLPIDPIKRELWRKRQSESHKGQRSSIRTEFKKGTISIFKGKHHTEGAKKILSENHKGMHNSIETEFRKGFIPWNKGLTKDTDEKVREAGIKTGNSQKGIPKPNVSKALMGRKLSKEHIRNSLRRRIPSSLEESFQKIIDKHNLPYKYVGNGKILIERYNPDFINTNNEKIAIEVYARYYKLRNNISIEKWKEERQKVFNRYGWKIIFFNEVEVNKKNVLKKLGKEVI